MKIATILKATLVLAFAICMFPAASYSQYMVTSLVFNQPPANGPAQPPLVLLNAWGLTQLQRGTGATPFWVSDNASGFSTLYSGTGVQAGLVVTIPAAPSSGAGALGTPTGIVGNNSTNSADFTITETATNPPKSGPAIFLFATQDGTIRGWNPGVELTRATIAVDRSSVGAVYTGLAIATDQQGQTFLFAADDGPNRRIDRFDGSFRVKSFDDPSIPSDFAPYGIQEIEGQIWVTFTALNNAQSGFVDVFDTEGNVVRHFAVTGPLHSPWGIALAPSDFGPMSNAILISNNTSRGRIDAFDKTSGTFLGPLRDANGKVIEIDQLWGIRFGLDGGPSTSHNQLFFTAGPSNYTNGQFGVITLGK